MNNDQIAMADAQGQICTACECSADTCQCDRGIEAVPDETPDSVEAAINVAKWIEEEIDEIQRLSTYNLSYAIRAANTQIEYIRTAYAEQRRAWERRIEELEEALKVEKKESAEAERALIEARESALGERNLTTGENESLSARVKQLATELSTLKTICPRCRRRKTIEDIVTYTSGCKGTEQVPCPDCQPSAPDREPLREGTMKKNTNPPPTTTRPPVRSQTASNNGCGICADVQRRRVEELEAYTKEVERGKREAWDKCDELEAKITELRKEVPKVVRPIDGTCPECLSYNHIFGVNKPFCGGCGSRLDWSEEDKA